MFFYYNNLYKKNPLKWRIIASFEINLHIKDIGILYQIQEFFGVGNVTSKTNVNLCVYRVTKLEDIVNVIIPHFLNYSLLTCKQADFKLWSEVVSMLINKLHLNPEGFNTILTYYASINRGVSKTIQQYFTNIIGVERPSIILPLNLNPFWISGFVAGDGSFNLGIRNTGQIYFNFNIAQHIRDLALMNLIFNYLGCGSVYARPDSNRCDFVIQHFKNIFDIIIPHFKNYPLNNIKSLDFEDFNEATIYFKEGGRDNTKL
jgi:hypothetical protein